MFTLLILRNYIPLADKGTQELVLDKLGLFNIVFGRNGNGKSSLLKQLTFFPPENADFDEGGYKEIQAIVNGRHYRLTSQTGKKSVHCFYVDNENLNKGMTMAVQKDLARQHTGLTQEIERILSGLSASDTFTMLSVARRKQVLMALNPNDVSLALRIHDKLKANLNQTKGVLKYQRQRLVNELKRRDDTLLTPLDELTYEISQLDKDIKEALHLKGMLTGCQDPDITLKKRKLDKLLQDILANERKDLFPPSFYHQLIDAANAIIENYSAKTIRIQTRLDDIVERIAVAGGQKKGQRVNLDDLAELLKILHRQEKTCQQNLTDLQNKIVGMKGFDTPDWQDDRVYGALSGIISALRDVVVATHKDIDAQAWRALEGTERDLRKKRDGLHETLMTLKHRHQHLQKGEKVTCPECDTAFVPGTDEAEKANVAAELSYCQTQFEKADALWKSVKDKRESNEGWFWSMKNLMGQLKQIDNYALHQWCVGLIKLYDVGKADCQSLVKTLCRVHEYGQQQRQLQRCQEEINGLRATQQRAEEMDLEALLVKEGQYECKLNHYRNKQRKYRRDIQGWEACLEFIESDMLRRSILAEGVKELDKLLIDKGKFKIRQEVDKRLRALSPRYDELLAQQLQHETFQEIVASIKAEVCQLEKRETHLKYLIEKLSPTRGLISQLMNDFLQSLCANVNAHLESVWTEPLTLVLTNAIDEESGELDYSFSVITTRPKKRLTALKKCSVGEQDIINFLVRFSLLRYYEGVMPLFMDEVGAAFDEQHRRRFAHYISTKAKMGQLPQVFMISHYVDLYGILTHKGVNMIKLNTEGLKQANALLATNVKP